MTSLILCLLMGDITDLGVISQRTGVAFESTSSRRDQCSVVVEFLPEGHPTNLVTLTLTNVWLTFGDMAPIPSGRGLMGVHFCYANGDRSEVAKYRYDLRRAAPPAPSARLVQVLGAPTEEKSLTNELRKIRAQRSNVFPPMPPIPEYTSGIEPRSQQIVDSKVRVTTNLLGDAPAWYSNLTVKALPGGTNLSYFQFLDRVADSTFWGRRRSE